MPSEELVLVPGRLHNPADGGHVAGASDIIDDDLNKLQSEINAEVKIFGASGNNHSAGLVPDPGSTQGNAKYLREDGLWESPPDTTYSTVSKQAAGLCPKLPNETTVTKFLRQDGTWKVPPYPNPSGYIKAISETKVNLCSNQGCGIFSIYAFYYNCGGTVSICGTDVKWLHEFNNPRNYITIALENNTWTVRENLGQWFVVIGIVTN